MQIRMTELWTSDLANLQGPSWYYVAILQIDQNLNLLGKPILVPSTNHYNTCPKGKD